MTLLDIFLPWVSLNEARREVRSLARTLRVSRKRVGYLETELLQTKRTGYSGLAKELGVSVEDLMKGQISPLLHDDPRAVYRALDNAQASEIKFRQVKAVNHELRYVIRQIIDGIYRLAGAQLSSDARAFLAGAENYAALRPVGGLPIGFETEGFLPSPTEGEDDGTARTLDEEGEPEAEPAGTEVTQGAA